MARAATARRPADGRAGRLDRPARRDLPVSPGTPVAVGPRPTGDGPDVPATPAHPFDPSPAEAVTPGAFWATDVKIIAWAVVLPSARSDVPPGCGGRKCGCQGVSSVRVE